MTRGGRTREKHLQVNNTLSPRAPSLLTGDIFMETVRPSATSPENRRVEVVIGTAQLIRPRYPRPPRASVGVEYRGSVLQPEGPSGNHSVFTSKPNFFLHPCFE